MNVESSDLVTILLLVALEGLLSADNALVMAIMVLGLPRTQHHRALRYGLGAAFAMRIAATLAAASLIRVAWVKLLGGLYLLYLVLTHFWRHEEAHGRLSPPKAKPWLGLSAFWATVLRVELVNLAFSIDSIVVAVAMSPKTWVVILGGILGIVTMRLVVGQLLVLIQRYPVLVDGAFVIIAWVALKLVQEFLHQVGLVNFEISKWLSIGFILAIAVVSYLVARKYPASLELAPEDRRAASLLGEGERQR